MTSYRGCHFYGLAGLAVGFVVVSFAYMMAASKDGFRLPHNATGMTAMWACLVGATGLVLELSRSSNKSERPYYRKAAYLMQYLVIPAMLFIAMISLASLQDFHGAIWAALTLVAVSIAMVMAAQRRRRETMGSPIVPLTQAVEKSKQQKQGQDGMSPSSTTTTPPPPPGRCRSCCNTFCLWCPLLFMMLMVLGFGIGAAITAREAVIYQGPGKFYLLKTSGSASKGEGEVKMHMYCTGTRTDPTRPLIVFEHGGGASSFSFYGVQQLLADSGIRSCAYDRPGFGWSESLPVGKESLAEYNHLVTSLLQEAGEAAPYILVGHSVGVEMVQIFAHNNPGAVAGVSLLDGYPDYLQLLGYSKTQREQDTSRVCSILQLARAFEAVGLIRPIYMMKSDFQPVSEAGRQASTYTNGHNFDSQWRIFCRSQAPDATTYLTTAAQNSSTAGHGENPDHPQVQWPQLPASVQVQIISASTTVLSKPAPGASNNMYFVQAQAYNETLSPSGQSEWVICDPCDHGFPETKIEYLHTQLMNLYNRIP